MVVAAVLASASEAADFVLFDVEVCKLMQVIISSLYMNKENFPWELI